MEAVPFISTQERDIVFLRNRGLPFPVIARKCNMAEQKVINAYFDTMERLKMLMKRETQLVDVFPCATVTDFLDQLGIPDEHPGRFELEAAIRLAYSGPEQLEHLNDIFYPALSDVIGEPADLIGRRVRKAICYAEEHKSVSEAAQSFFETEGVVRRHQMVKKFLLAAPAYICELE